LNNSKLTNVGQEYRSSSFAFQDSSTKENSNNKYDIGPYVPMANRPMGKQMKQEKLDKNKKKPQPPRVPTGYVMDFDDLGRAIKSDLAADY